MVTLAMRHRERDRDSAAKAAAKLLRSELRGELTGIMLAAHQALETHELPPSAVHKLELLCQAAERMRLRLG